MKKKRSFPKWVAQLRQAISNELDALVSIVKPGLYYRLTIVSPKFVGVPSLKRQDRVWHVVQRVTMPEQQPQIGLIPPYSDKEQKHYGLAV